MKSFWELTIEEREELAKTDPELLTLLGTVESDKLIENAPTEQLKTRLWGIQNEINREMSKLKNPLSRAAKMQEMLFHHKTGGLEVLRSSLNEVAELSTAGVKGSEHIINTDIQMASVLPFEKKVLKDEGLEEN